MENKGSGTANSNLTTTRSVGRPIPWTDDIVKIARFRLDRAGGRPSWRSLGVYVKSTASSGLLLADYFDE